MASKGFIGAMRDRALASLRTSSASLAALLDIAPPEKEQHYHDADYLAADRLRIFATFQEHVVEALSGRGDTAVESLQAHVQQLEAALAEAQSGMKDVELDADTDTGDEDGADAEKKPASRKSGKAK